MAMEVANVKGRAAALSELAAILAHAIDSCGDMKLLPQLTRQYRETVRELEEIDVHVDDDIESLVGDIGNVR